MPSTRLSHDERTEHTPPGSCLLTSPHGKTCCARRGQRHGGVNSGLSRRAFEVCRPLCPVVPSAIGGALPPPKPPSGAWPQLVPVHVPHVPDLLGRRGSLHNPRRTPSLAEGAAGWFQPAQPGSLWEEPGGGGVRRGGSGQRIPARGSGRRPRRPGRQAGGRSRALPTPAPPSPVDGRLGSHQPTKTWASVVGGGGGVGLRRCDLRSEFLRMMRKTNKWCGGRPRMRCKAPIHHRHPPRRTPPRHVTGMTTGMAVGDLGGGSSPPP